MFTSAAGALVSALGIGSGISVMPSLAATWFASSSETLRKEDTIRSRMAGTVTLLSSKRKAAAMWACSTGLWLSKKSLACV